MAMHGNKAKSDAWLRLQAAKDALDNILPGPASRQIQRKPMPVPALLVDGLRVHSERALRMAQEAGLDVDMTNNWPKQ